MTGEGTQLAREVSASTVLAEDAKTRLIAEIVNHESTHGRCTKTFIKKVRKQARGATGDAE
jgi:predicted secreted Zn-dependent protease